MLNSQFCDTQHLQRFLSWPHQKAYQNISITHPFKTKCPHHQCCTQYLCPQENHQKTIFKKRSHNNAVAVKTGSGKNVTSNTQKNKRNMLIVGLVISIEYKNTAHDTLWLGLLLNSWKLNSTVLATRKHMQNLSKRNCPAEIEVTMTLFCHPFEYSQNNCYRPIPWKEIFKKVYIQWPDIELFKKVYIQWPDIHYGWREQKKEDKTNIEMPRGIYVDKNP